MGHDAHDGARLVGEQLLGGGRHVLRHVAGVLGDLEVSVEGRLMARVHAHRGLVARVVLALVALPQLGERVALGLDPVLGVGGLGRGDGVEVGQVGQRAEVPVEVGARVGGPCLEHARVGLVAALLHELGDDLVDVEARHLVALGAAGVDGAEVAGAALRGLALLDGDDLDARLGERARGGAARDAQADHADVGVHGLGNLAELGLDEERRGVRGGVGGLVDEGRRGEGAAGGRGEAEDDAALHHEVAAGDGALLRGRCDVR